MLIDRAAKLSLQLALMDAKMVEPAGLTDHDHRVYLAWSNACSRVLRQLGLNAAPQPRLTPAEAMSRRSLPSQSVAA